MTDTDVEHYWNIVKDHTKRLIIIALVVNIAVIIFALTIKGTDKVVALLFFPFLTTIFCTWLWTSTGHKDRTRFQFMFKQRVILPELQRTFKDVQYAIGNHEAAQSFKFTPDSNPSVFPKTCPFITAEDLTHLRVFLLFDEFTTNEIMLKDFVSAEHKGCRFTRQNLQLRYILPHSKYGDTKTIFDGALITVSNKEKYPERLFICTSGSKSFFSKGIIIRNPWLKLTDVLRSDAKEKLAAGGITFDHDFCVFHENKKSARAILSPHRLEWLKQIDSLFPGDLALLFEDRTLCVFAGDTFEFDANTSGKKTVDDLRRDAREKIDTFVKQLDALIEADAADA